MLAVTSSFKLRDVRVIQKLAAVSLKSVSLADCLSGFRAVWLYALHLSLTGWRVRRGCYPCIALHDSPHTTASPESLTVSRVRKSAIYSWKHTTGLAGQLAVLVRNGSVNLAGCVKTGVMTANNIIGAAVYAVHTIHVHANLNVDEITCTAASSSLINVQLISSEPVPFGKRRVKTPVVGNGRS